MPKFDYLAQMLGIQPNPWPVQPGVTQGQDMFYRDPYRYDDKNLELRSASRNDAMRGMLGYPTDPQYMQMVRESNLTRDANRMSAIGDAAAKKYGSWRK